MRQILLYIFILFVCSVSAESFKITGRVVDAAEGNEPLILSNVKASCGCTTPKYTQKPVMPGEKGVIDVHYNTNNVGGFSKTVTVTSNAVNNDRVVLRIKGNVKQDASTQPAQPAQGIVKPVEAKEKPMMKEEAVAVPIKK